MSLKDAYLIKKNSSKRREHDYYPTAPIGTYSLCKYSDVPKKILEPAAGRGWISYELNQNGIETVSTDLYQYESPLVPVESGHDYLNTERVDGVDGVVTNPPYMNDLPQSFIEKSIKHYDYSAFFLRLTFMESISRSILFNETPPSDILVFSSRVSCEEEYFYKTRDQTKGMVANAWFIWDYRKYFENTTIRWINPASYMNEFVAKRGEIYTTNKPEELVEEKTLEDFF